MFCKIPLLDWNQQFDAIWPRKLNVAMINESNLINIKKLINCSAVIFVKYFACRVGLGRHVL